MTDAGAARALESAVDVETIGRDGRIYAYIVHAHRDPERTTFVTPDEALQQVGFVVHPAGAQIERHYHVPVERTIVGTPEVLVVRSGRCEIDVYDDDRELVATHELVPGDVMIMTGGGHGFRMLEDTVLLEVKQGPYLGPGEKAGF
jgi:hypothetical protein